MSDAINGLISCVKKCYVACEEVKMYENKKLVQRLLGFLNSVVSISRYYPKNYITCFVK